MNDMKITSKFNANDTVWFFEAGQVKFFEGLITDIQSWDKWGGFHYDIVHTDANGNTMNYNVEESRLYASKNEIITTLFEENGTPAPADAPSDAPVA